MELTEVSVYEERAVGKTLTYVEKFDTKISVFVQQQVIDNILAYLKEFEEVLFLGRKLSIEAPHNILQIAFERILEHDGLTAYLFHPHITSEEQINLVTDWAKKTLVEVNGFLVNPCCDNCDELEYWWKEMLSGETEGSIE